MNGKKCSKCGADIGINSKYCLNCGMPVERDKLEEPIQKNEPRVTIVEEEQQTQPPRTEPRVQKKNIIPKNLTSVRDIFDFIFTKTKIIIGIALGILFAWVGNIVTIYAEDSSGVKTGLLLNSFGFAVLGLFLIGGGIANKTLDKNVRTGMIFGGAILIGMSMVTSISSLYSSLLQF